MFILRTEEGPQGGGFRTNVILGVSYGIVHRNNLHFYKIAREQEYTTSEGKVDVSSIFAFVCCAGEDGKQKSFPLHEMDRYYVMTSKGETFEKIYQYPLSAEEKEDFIQTEHLEYTSRA